MARKGGWICEVGENRNLQRGPSWSGHRERGIPPGSSHGHLSEEMQGAGGQRWPFLQEKTN